MAIFFCEKHGAFSMADKLCECLKEQLKEEQVELQRLREEEGVETCEGCGLDFPQLFEDITGSKYCKDCFVEATAL